MFAGAGEPVGWGQSEAAKELRMKPRLEGGAGGGEVKGRREVGFA